MVAVLDDTLDQLSVLNSILPAAGKPSATTDVNNISANVSYCMT